MNSKHSSNEAKSNEKVNPNFPQRSDKNRVNNIDHIEEDKQSDMLSSSSFSQSDSGYKSFGQLDKSYSNSNYSISKEYTNSEFKSSKNQSYSEYLDSREYKKTTITIINKSFVKNMNKRLTTKNFKRC